MVLYRGWKITDAYNKSAAMIDDVEVNYDIGKWATPKLGNGPLAVFSNFNDAVKFNYDIDLHIHKCIYEKSNHDLVWYHGEYGDERCYLWDLPTGTILANKVMIVD